MEMANKRHERGSPKWRLQPCMKGRLTILLRSTHEDDIESKAGIQFWNLLGKHRGW
jgi:hypothetical protein